MFGKTPFVAPGPRKILLFSQFIINMLNWEECGKDTFTKKFILCLELSVV